jgi:hypothetical protein
MRIIMHVIVSAHTECNGRTALSQHRNGDENQQEAGLKFGPIGVKRRTRALGSIPGRERRQLVTRDPR